MLGLKPDFPAAGDIPAWHRRTLGGNPFPFETFSPGAAFFGPAAAACREPVPAEKILPKAAPAALLRRMRVSLRLWREAQRLTLALSRRWRPLRGMDLPMTLNHAMALGNYARAFLFDPRGPLPPAAALRLHAVFTREMTLMPALMALPSGRPAARYSSPGASAARLARAFAAELEAL